MYFHSPSHPLLGSPVAPSNLASSTLPFLIQTILPPPSPGHQPPAPHHSPNAVISTPLGSLSSHFQPLSTPSPQSWSFFFSTYITSSLEDETSKAGQVIFSPLSALLLVFAQNFGHTVLTQCFVFLAVSPLDHVL